MLHRAACDEPAVVSFSMIIRVLAVAAVLVMMADTAHSSLEQRRGASAAAAEPAFADTPPPQVPVPSPAQQTALQHKFSIFVHYSICERAKPCFGSALFSATTLVEVVQVVGHALDT